MASFEEDFNIKIIEQLNAGITLLSFPTMEEAEAWKVEQDRLHGFRG